MRRHGMRRDGKNTFRLRRGIGVSDLQELDAPLTLDEVKKAIKNFKSNKSAGREQRLTNMGVTHTSCVYTNC